MEKASRRVWVFIILYFALVFCCLLKPPKEYSVSERRLLKQRPAISIAEVISGETTKQVEEYVADQFPFRDTLRSIKSRFSRNVMGKQDIDGIYEKDGYLCEMEYPMDVSSIDRAVEVFEKLYEKNMAGKPLSVYGAVIPDKNMRLAQGVRPVMAYEPFANAFFEKADFMERIDVADMLEIEDYYRTDSHWRQECITDVAKHLANEMGTDISGEYQLHTVEQPFYGVYYGQAALPVAPDELIYCTNPVLDGCRVYDFENQKEISLYDMEKLKGHDAYEMFLGGNLSLVSIENPGAENSKELIIFGDSFCRSLAPLLAEGYEKVTVVDIRYLPSALIGNHISFINQDVLFIYSSSVLNNSITLK